ncbi:MAG: hypothetical protein AAB538_02240 [Patescibacteria group bacterium]
MAKPQVIGTVSHYYDHIGVAVVELTKPLKSGETVTFLRGEHHLVQPVTSMQIDHTNVEKAKAGTSVGVKVEASVQPGAKVYRGEVPAPVAVR